MEAKAKVVKEAPHKVAVDTAADAKALADEKAAHEAELMTMECLKIQVAKQEALMAQPQPAPAPAGVATLKELTTSAGKLDPVSVRAVLVPLSSLWLRTHVCATLVHYGRTSPRGKRNIQWQ